jgi:hypothetical protein
VLLGSLQTRIKCLLIEALTKGNPKSGMIMYHIRHSQVHSVLQDQSQPWVDALQIVPLGHETKLLADPLIQ